MAQEWPFKDGNGEIDLRCLRTSFAWIRHLRHYCADYAVNPPKQYGILSVDAGSKLVQKKYRRRHGKVGLQVHCELCRKYGLEFNDKLYDHQPLPVAENREVRITWDMTIFTDKRLKQSSRYYCSTQRHTGVENHRHCCASGPKYP